MPMAFSPGLCRRCMLDLSRTNEDTFVRGARVDGFLRGPRAILLGIAAAPLRPGQPIRGDLPP